MPRQLKRPEKAKPRATVQVDVKFLKSPAGGPSSTPRSMRVSDVSIANLLLAIAGRRHSISMNHKVGLLILSPDFAAQMDWAFAKTFFGCGTPVTGRAGAELVRFRFAEPPLVLTIRSARAIASVESIVAPRRHLGAWRKRSPEQSVSAMGTGAAISTAAGASPPAARSARHTRCIPSTSARRTRRHPGHRTGGVRGRRRGGPAAAAQRSLRLYANVSRPCS